MGVQGVVHVLWRVKIQLVAPEDDDSDMSEMDISNASIPPDHSEADPLAVDHGGPEQEEGEISEQSSSPDDVLGCDTYLDGGLASDTGTAPERIDGFQSEEMDTTAQPLGAESYSDRPMGSQDAQYDRSLPSLSLSLSDLSILELRIFFLIRRYGISVTYNVKT